MIGKSARMEKARGKSWKENCPAQHFHGLLNLDKTCMSEILVINSSSRVNHLRMRYLRPVCTAIFPPLIFAETTLGQRNSRGQSYGLRSWLATLGYLVLAGHKRSRRRIAKHVHAYVATLNVFVMPPHPFSTQYFWVELKVLGSLIAELVIYDLIQWACLWLFHNSSCLDYKRFTLILALAVTQIGVVLGVAINEEDVYCYTWPMALLLSEGGACLPGIK